jgi:mRNA interferase HigB
MPQDILDRYRSADILSGNRVVFNIKGNRYRLIVKIHYNTGIVYRVISKNRGRDFRSLRRFKTSEVFPIEMIRFIGTHAEYDRIDAETI